MYIYEFLNAGEENALTQKDLQTALGYPDTREVRAEIERERRAGHVICSGAAGYYLPESDQDVKRYVQYCLIRIRSSFINLRSAIEYLEKAEKKETLDRMLRDKGFEITPEEGLVIVKRTS